MMCVALCVFLGACAGPNVAEYQPQSRVSADPHVEAYVRAKFANTPVLIAIAECESNMRQWGANGRPLRGKVHPPDMGVFQINTDAHGTVDQFGRSMAMLEGNTDFAWDLFQKHGTRPWASSRHCWQRKLARGY